MKSPKQSIISSNEEDEWDEEFLFGNNDENNVVNKVEGGDGVNDGSAQHSGRVPDGENESRSTWRTREDSLVQGFHNLLTYDKPEDEQLIFQLEGLIDSCQTI